MSQPAYQELEQVPATKIGVLLVDDHMLVRAGLRAVLAPLPDITIVGEAASGEEAIALVDQCRPDVVVMDLDAAGDRGLAVTRALTAPASHPSILVLTMHPESDGVIDVLRAGAAGYLPKNVAEQELVTAIRVAAAGDVYVRPNVAQLLANTLRRRTQPAVDEARSKFEGLSVRERAVLQLVAEGNTGPEIGRSLGITAKTVDTYRHRIHEKTGLAHRRDYVRFALALGLLAR
jgi:DNA-binding NarL/FixJ family response regulator